MTRTERATSPRAILRDRFVNHNLIMGRHTFGK